MDSDLAIMVKLSPVTKQRTRTEKSSVWACWRGRIASQKQVLLIALLKDIMVHRDTGCV